MKKGFIITFRWYTQLIAVKFGDNSLMPDGSTNMREAHVFDTEIEAQRFLLLLKASGLMHMSNDTAMVTPVPEAFLS